MSNDFGKDLGLVHEAVITGRKVNVGKEFWAALAESPKIFGKVAPLVAHAAIVERESINLADTPSEEDICVFADWLKNLVGTCAGCLLSDIAKTKDFGVVHPANFSLLGKNEQEITEAMMKKEASEVLVRKINEKLKWLSISPYEVNVFMEDESWWERILHPYGASCLTPDHFRECLLAVRKQRKILAALEVVRVNP